MTQPLRNLTVQIASGDSLDVREFSVRERMSSLFEITLIALSENADVDFDDVVGQPASFRIHTGTADLPDGRLWTGICSHLQQIAVEEGGVSTYEITLVPTLWLATQRRNHRMFQRLSELDIARRILTEWGIEPELRISGTYKTREYRVQYAESDFAFVSRLLEDAGISYSFAQGDAGTRLVLSDAPQASERRRAPIPFRDNPTTAPDREHVTAVRVGQRVRPGRYTVRDHDPRLAPSYALLASAEAPGAGVEGRLERFHYTPGAFLFGTDQGEGTPHADDKGKTRTDEKEAAALARRRLEAKRASARACSFETNALDLAPGVVMQILDHPRSDLAEGKPLLVVESTLSGTEDGPWTHRCEALRADVAYRPPLVTPKPKISGVESATVVGPAGEEIHTDEFGRVRVHFHWDRESRMDDNSSCWIQVSQPWGGAGYGGSNLPRVGQEVLVDFLGGDPDRPVITGRVYTGLQTTPYKLPDSKTQSGWKSSSSPGGGGYNEIMFEDAAGQELLRMQAERDLHKLVKNDENVVIGNNRTKLVQNDDAFTVGNNRTKLVQNDEAVTIGNNRSKTVQNDETVTIGNDHARRVENDERVSIGNDHAREVENDESVTIGNDHTRSVQNDESVTIGNDLVHMVMANAREVTGLSRNVAVGVSRATQVGAIDSTMVGETHVVMVSPAGEGLDMNALTRSVMQENSIELATTEGANVTWKGATITLDANKPADNSATITMDAAKLELDMNGNATVTLSDDKIEVCTGGDGPKATISLVGPKIAVTADEISLATRDGASITLAKNNITIEAGKDGKVVIKGKPMVEVNPDH